MYRSLIFALALMLPVGSAYSQEPIPEKPAKQPPVEKNLVRPPKAAAARETPARASGRLFVQTNTWDFGHVPQNARVTHRFILENVGDDTLYIERIKPT